MTDIVDVVAKLAERIATLEWRLSNVVVEGPVEEVNPEKHEVRLRIGGTDEKPQLSGWIKYGQMAGDAKWHMPPSKGQQMTAIAKDGVPEKAVALPMTWSNANPSPSNKGDEDVYTRGALKETRRGDMWRVEIAGSSIEMTAGKLVLKGVLIEENP